MAHEPRIVDLQQEAGVDDRLVLLADRLREGEQVVFLALVIGVLVPLLEIGRRDRRHEHLLRRRGGRQLGQRSLEVVDVALELRVALINDRAGADHVVGLPRAEASRVVKLRE